jgi:hypothetical protein
VAFNPATNLGSASCGADPQPIAVWAAQFDLAPVRRLICRQAKLGYHRGDIAHEQLDESVWPGVTLVLGQEQPCPVPGDVYERGPVWLDAMLSLLGEPQAFVPGNRTGGVRHAQEGMTCSSMPT